MSWKKKILLGVIILSILSLFVDLEPKDTHISIEHPSEVETIEKKPAQTENPAESITTEKPVTDEESQTNDEYYLLTVDGGDISGNRQPNVKVDIGYGDRVYWAYTNEYGQLIKVTAERVIPQDDNTEPVTSDGRYYHDEAKVPGTEQVDLDEGHIIADSLGGVSNAYNITPQNSTLNRNGDQAYMEKVIRDAGGCTDFTAIISYPNTRTQIPSHYDYTYTLKGEIIHDFFANKNPEISEQTPETPEKTVTPACISPDTLVYVTPKGKSYHLNRNCSTLSRSKTILEKPFASCGKSDPCNRCVK